MGKFVKKTGKNGVYFFNLKSGNGETILMSEMYSTKAARDNGIESVQNNCTNDNRFDRKQSANLKSYFTLKAANGQVIGTSEMYESKAGMEKGIESTKVNGTTKTIVEE
jgi:uncharacterized protein